MGVHFIFCTDSVYCEYSHMDFIKSFGVSLIEMETSVLYQMADLLEKPAIALLAVSDNNTTGDPLLLRTAEQRDAYDQGRKKVIPDIIIAGLLVSAGVMSVFEKDRFSFTKRDRNVFLGIIALIVFTMPAMLLSWTSAGSDMIMGLQGRYFLPVLPLIFFVFTKFTVRVRTDSSRERITGIGRKYMIWFAVLSCLCVYFMMRLYLTR